MNSPGVAVTSRRRHLIPAGHSCRIPSPVALKRYPWQRDSFACTHRPHENKTLSAMHFDLKDDPCGEYPTLADARAKASVSSRKVAEMEWVGFGEICGADLNNDCIEDFVVVAHRGGRGLAGGLSQAIVILSGAAQPGVVTVNAEVYRSFVGSTSFVRPPVGSRRHVV
jgi:hypothetical protein